MEVIVSGLIFAVFIFGFYRKVDVYDVFLSGAKDGAKSLFAIFPNIIAVMAAVSMLKASGFIDILASVISPVLALVNLPQDVLPLALFRPLSGSAALAVTEDIIKSAGADSRSGLIASVMMGSTETTFYTVAMYFGTCGVKNVRHTIFAALAADIAAVIISTMVVKMWFGV